jgi:hypothetical protein
LYSAYLTKETLGQVIHTVKYVDDLVLPAKEEAVPQGMIDRLIKIARRYGMEMNVEQKYGNENLKATIPNTDYDRSKTTGECGIFQLFW